MIPPRQGVIAVAFALVLFVGDGQCLAQGQALGDPMQPPAFTGSASETADGRATSARRGMVLQSTITSRGRRIAMIDGKSLNVGDRIGESTIVAIDPASVTLREAGVTRVLKLYEGVEISNGSAAKAPASRTGTKKGTK